MCLENRLATLYSTSTRMRRNGALAPVGLEGVAHWRGVSDFEGTLKYNR